MARAYSKEKIDNQISLSRLPHDLVWFSHREKEFEVLDIGIKKIFRWKENEPPETWDWDNCTVSRAKILSDKKVRIVIRSKTNRNSKYMGRIPVELRYMLGIDIGSISEPCSELYTLKSSKRKNLPKSAKEEPHIRWVCKLDEKYWIWQWARNDIGLEASQVYRLYEDIKNFLKEAHATKGSRSERSGGNIFNVDLAEKLDEVVPVIYQPAIDSLKNFLREVHCVKVVRRDSLVDVEVSLLFNNEELRRHRHLDRIYSIIRLIKYGRTRDVETFRIRLSKPERVNPNDNINGDGALNHENDNKSKDRNDTKFNNRFIFDGIYSGQYDIEHDTIHIDAKRRIEYYFLDRYHPIIFINTANHAMGEHDNNHDIWKWEYIPWIKRAPIKLGFKSRKDIDLRFTPFLKRLLKLPR